MKLNGESLRICILESDYTEGGEAAPFPTYLEPYLEGHRCETHRIDHAQARAQVAALVADGFDVFINLCDGAAGSKSAG